MKTSSLFLFFIKWLPAVAVLTALTLPVPVPAGMAGRDRPANHAGKDDPPPKTEQVRPDWWESRREIYFGIPARVLFKTSGKQNPGGISQKAWDEFERIGKIFNPYDPDSETARLNQANTRKPIPVSRDMFRVLEIAGTLWVESDGAFDPTMLPIKQLWREAVDTQQVPNDRAILGALSNVGFGRVRLLPDTQAVVLENDRIQFDFGGIAKGYAVDRVIGVLEENGIPAALVQLGGEITAFGDNDGKEWRIGVEHPNMMNETWGVVSARERLKVSTSGNYQQPLVIAGHRFYHIFSPKTGKPVSEKILGVTTATLDGDISSALLDGAATAITVMGTTEGIRFARKIGIEALVLKKSADDEISENLTTRFKVHFQRASDSGK